MQHAQLTANQNKTTHNKCTNPYQYTALHSIENTTQNTLTGDIEFLLEGSVRIRTQILTGRQDKPRIIAQKVDQKGEKCVPDEQSGEGFPLLGGGKACVV